MTWKKKYFFLILNKTLVFPQAFTLWSLQQPPSSIQPHSRRARDAASSYRWPQHQILQVHVQLLSFPGELNSKTVKFLIYCTFKNTWSSGPVCWLEGGWAVSQKNTFTEITLYHPSINPPGQFSFPKFVHWMKICSYIRVLSYKCSGQKCQLRYKMSITWALTYQTICESSSFSFFFYLFFDLWTIKYFLRIRWFFDA